MGRLEELGRDSRAERSDSGYRERERFVREREEQRPSEYSSSRDRERGGDYERDQAKEVEKDLGKSKSPETRDSR